MKRFHFPLKSVATVREAKESKARDTFVAAVQVVAKAERHLEGVRSEKAELEKMMLQERKQNAFRASEQMAFIHSHRRLLTRETEAISAVKQAVQVREQRRDEWMVSRRDVRLIEKLKEAALKEYRAEAEREAQRLLDDHANAAVIRAR
ncbi:MAG TPA: flagellar FliJ family protein [Opitutaceae bacterium]|nr:flagellar FliJ family protein [Opitutaceae bacterium]